MNIRCWIIVGFVFWLIGGVLAAPASAQSPKPKAGKKPPAAASNPQAEDGPKQADKKPAGEESIAEDPAVAAILAAKPTTPAECVRAAKILADLGHANFAKDMLKKAIDAKLEREQLANLGVELGSPVFVDLANRPALQPEGKKLADAVLTALDVQQKSTARVIGWIRQLQDPSEEKRLQAIDGLQRAQGAAIGPLTAVLADPARKAEYANVRAALAEMGHLACGPLVAALDQSNSDFTVQAIEVLGAMNDPKAATALLTPYWADGGNPKVRHAAEQSLQRLTGRIPSRDEAIRLLTDTARAYFDGRQPIEGVVNGRVDLWHWDVAGQRSASRSMTPEEASRAMAAQWAGGAFVIAPKTATCECSI